MIIEYSACIAPLKISHIVCLFEKFENGKLEGLVNGHGIRAFNPEVILKYLSDKVTLNQIVSLKQAIQEKQPAIILEDGKCYK